jgi:hypothetical protein
MLDNHRPSITSSTVPLISTEDGIELNPIRNDYHSIDSDRNSSQGKADSVGSRLQQILTKAWLFNVEERGIERILPENRTDSRIFNTAMIWVKYIHTLSSISVQLQ